MPDHVILGHVPKADGYTEPRACDVGYGKKHWVVRLSVARAQDQGVDVAWCGRSSVWVPTCRLLRTTQGMLRGDYAFSKRLQRGHAQCLTLYASSSRTSSRWTRSLRPVSYRLRGVHWGSKERGPSFHTTTFFLPNNTLSTLRHPSTQQRSFHYHDGYQDRKHATPVSWPTRSVTGTTASPSSCPQQQQQQKKATGIYLECSLQGTPILKDVELRCVTPSTASQTSTPSTSPRRSLSSPSSPLTPRTSVFSCPVRRATRPSSYEKADEAYHINPEMAANAPDMSRFLNPHLCANIDRRIDGEVGEKADEAVATSLSLEHIIPSHRVPALAGTPP
jgi:hypothetical protein